MRRSPFFFGLGLVAVSACSSAPEPAPAPTPAPRASAQAANANTALFTEAQSDRGRQLFREECSDCHYSSEMSDDGFQFEWERRSVGALLDHVSGSMPDDDPGSLTPQQYVDVIAYILNLNGFPAGGAELEPGAPALATLLKRPGS